MSSVSERLLCLQQIKRIQASTNSTEDILKAIEGRNKRTVLIVGGGGREHAIALKLSESPDVDRIICAPGNAGTSGSGKISNEKVDDIPAYAQSNNVHLVVVGPEVPLVAGLADDLAKLHIPCFGPSAAAAQIEASKAWAKEFMNRHNIPTSQHRTFKRDELSSAEEYVKTCGFRLVVKASGLAAGKGVLIPESQEETLKALSDVFLGNAFGAAGDEVVLEERMEGPEASMLAFCDGKTVQMMPAAQDHKRALDNDNGLNTGGMGAYAPAPIITEAIANQIKVEVLEPALAGLAQEGRPFVGVLYAGMMLTTLGPKVIEFNCRFGDPETQVILPLLKSDLLHIMEACVTGTLDTIKVDWSKQHAVTIVAASEGYPLSYPKGRSIKGMNIVSKLTNANGDSATVYHAGTRVSATDANTIETSGGRVLAVTALSTASLQSAVSTAYAGMRAINFEGMQYRYDIARRALSNNTTTGETKENMPTLRIGVLGSTRGTDLASLIKAIDNGRLNGGKIVCVVSNKSKAIILEKARVASIPAIALKYTKNMSRDDYDAQVTKTLKEYSVDVVLMIGYMRIVSPSFTAEWAGKLLNVHPSLLPEFAGGMDMDVHAEVLKAKKTITGCTVHLVTDVVDGGEIVARRHCSVGENDTADTLKARVQAMEGEALLSSLRAVQDGTVMAIHNAENSVGSSSTTAQVTYADAGVSIEEGNALIEDIKPHCKATRRPGCDASLGGFGGCFDLRAAQWTDQLKQMASKQVMGSDVVLVACTDGVGTKLKVAQIAGRHDTVGIDLVAMSVNDLIVQGAEPLFFLDYFACGKLNRGVASAVVRGIAKGCQEALCGLIGGETAEMPSMYPEGEYDLAGFAVGAVRRNSVLPVKLSSGDVVIGMTSSGVHSNGFSLVRKLVDVHGLDWTGPAPFPSDVSDSSGSNITNRFCDEVLTPTRIYVKSLLPLLGKATNGDSASPCSANGVGKIKALAHITGGGLVENIPRVLTGTNVVDIDGTSWSDGCPNVFKWIASLGSVPVDDMFRTFNCGIGMVCIVAKEDVDEILTSLRAAGEGAYVIGLVREEKSPNEERVQITGTPF